jgi:hypothetical protein
LVYEVVSLQALLKALASRWQVRLLNVLAKPILSCMIYGQSLIKYFSISADFIILNQVLSFVKYLSFGET